MKPSLTIDGELNQYLTVGGQKPKNIEVKRAEKWRKNARAATLIDRLRSNAMGDFVCAPLTFTKLCKDMESLGIDMSGKKMEFKELIKKHFMNVKMDMAQVKSAEIVLKKVIPDLAQHEYIGEVKHTAVIALPARADDSKSWVAAQTIEHKN